MATADDPPLILDIDGTLTRPDGWGIDPRIFDPIREWDAPVVIATGSSTLRMSSTASPPR